MKAIYCLLLVGISVLALAAGAQAAEKTWICSIVEGTEVSEGFGCYEPDFDGVQPPSFLQVDIDRKLITLLAPASRRGEASKIDLVRETDDGWMLSGMDAERVWSMYLTTDGNMTLSLSMDGTTWSAFGRCMPADHAKP